MVRMCHQYELNNITKHSIEQRQSSARQILYNMNKSASSSAISSSMSFREHENGILVLFRTSANGGVPASQLFTTALKLFLEAEIKLLNNSMKPPLYHWFKHMIFSSLRWRRYANYSTLDSPELKEDITLEDLKLDAMHIHEFEDCALFNITFPTGSLHRKIYMRALEDMDRVMLEWGLL